MASIFGVGDDKNLLESPKPAKPRATPTPTPPPPPSAVPTSSAILKRNQEFDAMRTKAIGQLLQHDIDPAVETFNAAYRIKPNDRSIQIWLNAIKLGKEKQLKVAKDAPAPGQFQNNGSAGSNAAPAAGGAPQVPAVPPMPGAKAPQAIPSISSNIDPRLVF